MSAKQKRVLSPLLIISCITVSVIVAASTRGRSELLSKSAPQTNAATIKVGAATTNAQNSGVLQATLLGGPVQNIRFTLYDVGIYPREVRVVKGEVGIAIEDRTGNSAGLVIEREVGTNRVPVGQVRRFAEHNRGRGQVRLEPGRYQVFDTSRPTNHAVLLVEP